MTAYEMIQALAELPADAHVGVSISVDDLKQINSIERTGEMWLLTESFSIVTSANKQMKCGTITISS